MVPPCGASVWGFRIQGWLAGIANTSAGTATWCCSKEPNLWVHLGSNLNSVSSSVICAYNVCYITLPTKVCIVKAMVFPVVVYGCESWSIKEAEHWKTDPFKLWCWRRFLRVPWTVRRSNQSILKEINPGYSLEGLMLKLKLQYFGHLMGRTDPLEKTLMLGKIEGRRRRGQQRMRWLDCIIDSMDGIWANFRR